MGKRNFSLKIKYFIFFLLIGFISSALFTFVYWFGYLKSQKENIELDFNLGASRIFSSLEQKIQNIDNMSLEFSNYLYESDVQLRDRSVFTKEAFFSNLLIQYEALLGEEYNAFYYEFGSSNIYTSEGLVDYNFFSETYLEDIPIIDIPFFSKINEKHDSAYYASSGMYTFYFKAVPFFEFIPEGTFIIRINNNFIDEAVQSSFPYYDIDFLVTSASYGKIFYSDRFEEYDNYVTDSSIAFLQDSNKVISSNYISPVLNDRFYLFVDKDALYKSYYSSVTYYFIILIVLAIAIIIASYYLASYAYNPIEKLMKQIFSGSDKLSGNELELISSEWDHVQYVTDRLKMDYKSQNEALISLVISGLLSEHLPDRGKYSDYFHSFIQHVLVHPFFQVIVADCIFTENEIDLFDKAISCYSSNKVIFVQANLSSSDLSVIVVNSEFCDNAYALDIVDEIARVIITSPYRLAAGKIYDSFLNLNRSYIEALTALKQTDTSRTVFDDSDISLGEYLVPVSSVNMFTQALSSGDSAIALTVIDMLFERMDRFDKNNPLSTGYLYDILNMVIRGAGTLGYNADFSFDINNIDKFRQQLRSYTEMIALARNDEIQINSNEEKNKVIEFVDQNYLDPRMSLSFISEHFSRSISYISRLFKSEGGVSFVDYLRNIRIRWIKKQLEETDLSVKDIIAKSGYSDISGVMRTFKQLEGITMSQYRVSKQKQ